MITSTHMLAVLLTVLAILILGRCAVRRLTGRRVRARRLDVLTAFVQPPTKKAEAVAIVTWALVVMIVYGLLSPLWTPSIAAEIEDARHIVAHVLLAVARAAELLAISYYVMQRHLSGRLEAAPPL